VTRSGEPPRACLDGRRILVAEDELVIAMEVQYALEDAGGEVVGPAYTVAEALSLAHAQQLDGAVLDLRLGARSADEIAQLLTRRGVPFIFYSGQTASDPERAKWPKVQTVSKPASGRTLVNAVVELLDHPSPAVI